MIGNLLKIVGLLIVLMIVKSFVFPAKTSSALRITAEVETPQGLRTGTSVVEQVSKSIPKWLPGSYGNTLQLKGESPVVDLGDGNRLFVLLRDENGHHDVMDLFRRFWQWKGGSLNVQGDLSLVTFSDPDDAASVTKVSPANLAATFGDGYHLRRIIAEPISGPPTFGALDEIPLFKNYILKLPSAQRIAGKGTGEPLRADDPTRLMSMSFRQGHP